MLSKRVIPCLDVRNGRLTKGVKFVGNEDIGDPVETARRYYEEGADEIVFYDITASAEARGIFIDVVERVAEQIFIPFSVGGGISSVADMRAVLLAGAEKVSVNSAAVKDPHIISDGADAFGSQAIVVGMDVLAVPASAEIPSGYEIVIHGGRKRRALYQFHRRGRHQGRLRTQADPRHCRRRVHSRYRLGRRGRAAPHAGGRYHRRGFGSADRLHCPLRAVFHPPVQGIYGRARGQGTHDLVAGRHRLRLCASLTGRRL